jgi:protein TonB
MLIRDDEPRQLIISADTRESVIAAYLDNWKRRIEAVGEAYLPQLGELDDISGSPTLMVAIDTSGNLNEAVIRKSSGSTILDLAALDILNRASPFDPFPPEVAAEYDVVRFEYKWLFADQLVSSTSD